MRQLHAFPLLLPAVGGWWEAVGRLVGGWEVAVSPESEMEIESIAPIGAAGSCSSVYIISLLFFPSRFLEFSTCFFDFFDFSDFSDSCLRFARDEKTAEKKKDNKKNVFKMKL